MNYSNKVTAYIFSSRKKQLLILFIFCLFSLGISNKLLAGYFNQVITWSSECFYTKSLYSCRAAIKVTETFQLLAASKDSHRCQTSLLALEAKLIMVSLNSSKGRRGFLQSLDNVKQLCEGTFDI